MSDEIDRIRQAYQRREQAGLRRRYRPTDPGHAYLLVRYREEYAALLSKCGLLDPASARILEVGCGRGQGLTDWIGRGAAARSLHGIDLIEPFAAEARRAAPGAHVVVGAADRLPYRDASFDIVAQHTMFTSIVDDTMKRNAAREMQRVLAANGTILWFDFRYSNPFNRDVCGVAMKEIALLFPDWRIAGRAISLLPPLARLLAPLSVDLCRFAEAAIPPLRSHYLLFIRKPLP